MKEIPLGRPCKLTESDEETVPGIIEFYIPYTTYEVVNLVRLKSPWKEAVSKSSADNEEISLESMARYYSSL